ncbi:MAG: YceI family protein, partial [Anaerolineae bacterium]|nr:YceI family protein [Anaerolineae bacterium]
MAAIFKNKTRRTLFIGAAVLALVGLGIGLYAFDTFIGFSDDIDENPPVAPTLEAAAQGRQVVYRIDATQSEVRYNIDEVFLDDNTLASPVGRTQGIAGDVLIDFENPQASQVGTVVINIEQFASDSGLRDRAIRRNWLESSTYPEATFVPREILDFPAEPVPGEPFTFRMVGDLTVKTTTAEETWEVEVTLAEDESTLTGQARTAILLSTYDVGPIEQTIPPLRTEDELRLEFDFVALRVEPGALEASAEADPAATAEAET